MGLSGLVWDADGPTIRATAPDGRTPVTLPVRAPSWTPEERERFAEQAAAVFNAVDIDPTVRLTPTQARIHAALIAWFRQDPRPAAPTTRELAQIVGCGHDAVARAYHVFRDAGIVQVVPGRHRSVMFLDPPTNPPAEVTTP